MKVQGVSLSFWVSGFGVWAFRAFSFSSLRLSFFKFPCPKPSKGWSVFGLLPSISACPRFIGFSGVGT